jgi:8-amino-7-oxononanoate synthase
MAQHLSLEEYAFRRARVQGQAILEMGNPWLRPIDTLAAETRARGNTLISFANYDYLGLARHPQIEQAAVDALRQFGAGALGSRLVGGERTIHAELENGLAAFVGTQSSLVTASGYLTNATLISHLLGSNDLVIVDELSHHSIIASAQSTRAKIATFRHNDVDHLAHVLQTERENYGTCLIAVEGLYSMDGDVPSLPRMLALKERHHAWLLVDEAHSIGVLGDHGRGICEHFGEDPERIDLIVGTLSKTFVTCGGFICARKRIVDWLKYTLPGFIYSVGIPPMTAGAAKAALEKLIEEPVRVSRLQRLSEHFLTLAHTKGLRTGDAIGRGIIPVLFDNLREAMSCSQALLTNGIFAPPIVQLGMTKVAPRLRFFVSAGHERPDIDAAVNAIAAHEETRRANVAISCVT